jgi:hypothetical protein
MEYTLIKYNEKEHTIIKKIIDDIFGDTFVPEIISFKDIDQFKGNDDKNYEFRDKIDYINLLVKILLYIRHIIYQNDESRFLYMLYLDEKIVSKINNYIEEIKKLKNTDKKFIYKSIKYTYKIIRIDSWEKKTKLLLILNFMPKVLLEIINQYIENKFLIEEYFLLELEPPLIDYFNDARIKISNNIKINLDDIELMYNQDNDYCIVNNYKKKLRFIDKFNDEKSEILEINCNIKSSELKYYVTLSENIYEIFNSKDIDFILSKLGNLKINKKRMGYVLLLDGKYTQENLEYLLQMDYSIFNKRIIKHYKLKNELKNKLSNIITNKIKKMYEIRSCKCVMILQKFFIFRYKIDINIIMLDYEKIDTTIKNLEYIKKEIENIDKTLK